jgi:hypothetical protein
MFILRYEKSGNVGNGGQPMQTADVVIHVDETVDHDRRLEIAGIVRTHAGVTDVINHDERPHLMIVRYDPRLVTAEGLLAVVRANGVHAELVGL